ncbi:MAG: ABC transporter substrate-binding protein [Candidatus Rokubacteria bacterium]|nr:ABC transporter substrate-binding protein [Candidatus Rokubacteria bacterium]
MKRIVTLASLVALALVVGLAPAADAQKKQLVVGLNQDPDILDPTLARTYVGRIVFSHICEKLYEIDDKLQIQPQLAAELPQVADGGKTLTIKLRPNVRFNDGSAMTAEAVRFSIDRHMTLKGSNRRSELASIDKVEVVDPTTIRLRLKAPAAQLLSQLTDRAGMPVSPAAVQKLGDNFGTAPVCVGPWQFVERVAQDRIVVEKSKHYFDQSAAKFERVVFKIIPDDNVRLANLRSGDIDITHQVTPTDAAALKKEGRFEVASVTGLGYNGITINHRNKTGKTNPPGDLGTPLANDPRVREAFELSLDRDAIVQVVYDGQYTAGCTPVPPISPFFDKSRPCPARDVAKAKKLLADAGLAGGYSFELVVVNNPQQRRIGEVIQQMAKEAGFTVTLRPQEFASALNDGDAGKHQAFLIGWSGRVDPDGNVHQGQTCKGALNAHLACDAKIDALLDKAREVSDVSQRRGLYREAFDLLAARRSIIYLYHPHYIAAHAKNLKGYTAVPDGLVRIKGTSWQ